MNNSLIFFPFFVDQHQYSSCINNTNELYNGCLKKIKSECFSPSDVSGIGIKLNVDSPV